MPLFDRPPIDAISVSNALFSSGTFRITGGPGVTVGSDASGASISGQALSLVASNSTWTSGFFRVSGGANVTVGSDGSGATISAGWDGSFWDNMFPDPNAAQIGSTISAAPVDSNIAGGRLKVMPLSPIEPLFPMNMSVTRMDLDFTGKASTSSTNLSAAFTSSFYLGFYTRQNSTQLSLWNSVLLTTAAGASTANYSRALGARYLSFHSSLFSSAPNFSQGDRYWFAQLIRTAGNLYTSVSYLNQFGMNWGMTAQRSGQLGAASSGNSSFNAWYPFMGVHSLTTFTALPSTIAHSDINKVSTHGNFVVRLLLNAGLAPVE